MSKETKKKVKVKLLTGDIKKLEVPRKALLESLARGNFFQRSEAARDPELSEELMLLLARDSRYAIKKELAQNNNLSAEATLLLAFDKLQDTISKSDFSNDHVQLARARIAGFKHSDNDRILNELTSNNELIEKIKDIFKTEFSAKTFSSQNRLKKRILDWLAINGDIKRNRVHDEHYIKQVVARRNDTLLASTVEYLATFEDSHVQLEIAKRKDIPKKIIQQLSRSKYRSVRMVIHSRYSDKNKIEPKVEKKLKKEFRHLQ